MNKFISILFFALVFCIHANAQTNMESVLAEIAGNNKTIQANTQYWETQKLQYKTGNSPYNPAVEYDFLAGSPAEAGNQHDLTIVQQFDFPTAYIKKSQLAETQIAQAAYQLTAARQDILLEAKRLCIELVYQNKLQKQLALQKQNTEKILSDFQIKLTQGEGNILDVNKAKLQLIQIKKQVQQTISDIAQLNQKLSALNGGALISFTDTSYFLPPVIPTFEQLENEYENADPLRKILEQEKLITKKQLELSKAMWLPKMELGYHYQGILGQTYNGIHTGISIPLWENKNTVKLQQSKLHFTDLEIADHRTTQYFEIKNIYEKYVNLKITLEEYETSLEALNSSELLNKALALGELTTLQYFMETNYYTEAYNNYLLTESEYYQAIAALYKFAL